MTNSSQGLQILVTEGQAGQAAVGLQLGASVDTFSVGSSASWTISAPGVAAEHLYLYFDGTTLFAALADVSLTANVSGRPLTTDWTEVPLGETISFGQARITFQTLAPPARKSSKARKPPNISKPEDDDEKTVMKPLTQAAQQAGVSVPMPPASPKKAKKLKLRSSARKNAPPEDGEATLYNPIPSTPGVAPAPAFKPPPGIAAPPPAPMPAPSTPAPAPSGPPDNPFWGNAAARQVPGAPSVPPPPAPNAPSPSPGDDTSEQASGIKGQVLKAWRESSVVQKILVALLPFAFGAVHILFSNKHPQTARIPHPSTSVAAARHNAKPPTSNTAKSAASTAPSNSGEAAESDSGTPPANNEQPSTADNESPEKIARKETSKSNKTDKRNASLERQAADAVAAGKIDLAISLYDKLTNLHPDKKAFREAAKILRETKRAEATPSP